MFTFNLSAQTLGGRAAFNFLNLPSSPLLSAAGGINTSYDRGDVGLSLYNPALLKPELHSNIGVSFNNYFAGISAYNLSGAYHHQKLNTTFGANVFFIDYGSVPQTDASGNIEGNFRPIDYAIQLSVSRTYMENWRYGISAKFINSQYGQFTSNAIAFDVGLLYSDTANGFTASVVAKNMGTQLKSFTQEKDDLPFDLQIGITKRLEKAPFGFSLTAHHLHRFDITFEDAAFNEDNNVNNSKSGITKAFHHLVFATHIYIGQTLEATIGYNALRRHELNIGVDGNGLNGFSMGMQARFKKMHVQYARSYFQRMAYNQFGINIILNQMFGSESL